MALLLAIVGIACVAYGVTVMMVGSGTWFFAFWFVLGAVLLGAAWAVHAGWWDALSVLARRVIGVLVAVVLVVYAVTLGLQLKGFGQSGEPGLDYLIVLGAQVRDDGPSTVLRYRLDAAYGYLVSNDGTICIVSGGQGFNEPEPEADVMARYLEERGIDPARIIREDQARNTVENITFGMAYFDPAVAKVGIVTNNFHVFRAEALARKAGIAHVCGISATSAPYYLLNNMTRESMGIVKDFIQGNC